MDKGKGGRDGETSDTIDHSHRNKADDAFLAEEDQDYDELYGNMDLGVKDNGVEHKKLLQPPPPLPPMSVQNAGEVSLPGASGTGQEQPFYGVGVGSSLFYLGNLHWWTRDADIEYELCKYGEVKSLRIFLHEDCGKSKGYCEVEFYDPLAAAACKKALIGHEFNGRMCVVSSSVQPFIRMTEPDEVEATKAGDGINQGGYGRGNWGRGNNLGNGNPMTNWGGGPIRMGGPMPSYRGVGSHGLVPYANHSFYGRGMPMNGSGMIPRSGMRGPNMGMWPGSDMGRLCGDENGGGKVAEIGYGEEAAPEHQYNEVDRDRGDLSNAMREKDRGLERDLPGTSERTFKDDRVDKIDRYVLKESNSGKYARDRDRERDRDRDRRRERGDRDKYADHHRLKNQSRKYYSHNGKRRQFNF